MFIRRLKNRSESTSIQVISKNKDHYKVVKTIGCATMLHKIEKLELIGRQEIEKISDLENKLFGFDKDEAVEQVLSIVMFSSYLTIN